MIWDKAIKFVLDYEGRSYENDPNDAGGETKFGISKAAYPNVDIKALTEEAAVEIYRRDYWEPLMADQLPDKVAFALFDSAVNQGPKTAVKLLQSSLDVPADGVMGPRTIDAARRAGDDGYTLLTLYRARLYMESKDAHIFGGNWGTRLIQIHKALFGPAPVS